jgi:hypothetical protein
MKNHLLFFALLLSFVPLTGQNLNLGPKFQKTHSLYWENGISAQYSFKSFKSDQFYIGLEFLSSRLGSAFSSNAIKQDNFITSIAWHFRKNKSFRIITKLNVGLFKADLEEEIFSELPNSTTLLSPEIGLSYNLKSLPLVVNLGSGFNMNIAEGGKSPGTQQPLYYHLTFYYDFHK